MQRCTTMSTSNTPKHPILDDDDPWDYEFEYGFDDPETCAHCGGQDGKHKYGCHLIKAIAEAIEKDKSK